MAKTCNNCTEHQNVMVPYVVHEAEVSRQERQHKRLWVALIVLLILWFLTNLAWLLVFNSYDYSSEEVIIEAEQDGSGVNIVGGEDVDYGAEGTDNDSEEEEN